MRPLLYLDKLLELSPYSLNKIEKEKIFKKILYSLNFHHYKNCSIYSKIINSKKINLKKIDNLIKIPFLPTRIFKFYDLKSVSKQKVIKILTSSGTSDTLKSKIFLDSYTAKYQTRVLNNIVTDHLGSERLPMLIIDSKDTLQNKKSFSARVVGTLGFSRFGKEIKFLLDDNYQINYKILDEFYKKNRNKKILIFGFTSLIWQNFYTPIKKQRKKYDFKNAIIVHGGGWKKLEKKKVSNKKFKNSIYDLMNIQSIHNYYGLVEQTGSIFIECNKGYFHCSNYSDIIIRNKNFEKCNTREVGYVQLLSLLPHSYPGHSILTEDLGMILGDSDCKCGRQGKYFKIYGRIEKSEIRGCSDA